VRFSVWNAGTQQFDYFEDGVPETTNVAKPAHLTSRTLGSTVEQSAWPLPANATPVGSGPHAVGRVAIARSGALGADDGGTISLVKIGLLLAAGALGAKVLLPKRRKKR
jgi:hypothetical protein